MKRANKLMLFAGVVLAAVSFVAVLAFGGLNQAQEAPPPSDVAVVVASQDLPLGTALTAEQLTTVTRPEPDAQGTYQHPDELLGLVVRRSVAQGQALTDSDFQTSVSVPDLVRSIQPGMRAVAVPLSRVDSVGGLLQAGDYVDVLLSMEDLDGLNPVVISNPRGYQITEEGTILSPYLSIDDYVNNTTVKVVVQNVQVLAALPPVLDDPSNNMGTVEIQPDVIAVIAVTPQQSEVIRFAQLDGRVSLALRSPGDATSGEIATSGMTLKQLVDVWGVLPPQPVAP